LKIGILSDTHDNVWAIDKAIEVFRKYKVEYIFHAGDWVAPFSLVRLARSGINIVGVLGNNECEKRLMFKKAREHSNVELEEQFMEKELEGVKIALYHGTSLKLVEALVKSKLYNIVIYGHTHKPEIRKAEDVLVVNPGEASGVLTGKRTVAIVNLKTLDVELLEI